MRRRYGPVKKGSKTIIKGLPENMMFIVVNVLDENIFTLNKISDIICVQNISASLRAIQVELFNILELRWQKQADV